MHNKKRIPNMLMEIVVAIAIAIFVGISAPLQAHGRSSQNHQLYLPLILNIDPIPEVTYDVYWDRALWENAVGGNVATEDFEKDEADYGELSFPYITGNGFTLIGQSHAQIIEDPSLLDSGNLLHFRDWEVGLKFIFPNNASVTAFGFDYRPSETWNLTVNQFDVTITGGRKGFVGIVIHGSTPQEFVLWSNEYAQGGLSVDNISYVEK
jgi:hypothetical protein